MKIPDSHRNLYNKFKVGDLVKESLSGMPDFESHDIVVLMGKKEYDHSTEGREFGFCFFNLTKKELFWRFLHDASYDTVSNWKIL